MNVVSLDIFSGWDELEAGTEAEKKIPFIHTLPQNSSHYPYCQWVKSVNSISFKNLSANQIEIDPHLRRIIACSYPDFKDYGTHWELIKQQVNLVIDLTNEEDRIRIIEERGIWLPLYPAAEFKIRDTKTNDFTQVEYVYEKKKSYYLLNDFGNQKVRWVKYGSYSDWPDGGVISIEALHFLVKCVNKYLINKEKVLIHCYAGVGRTGTLITAATIYHKIETGRFTKENFDIESLANLILNLRAQRSAKFVSTFQQFKLLYAYGRWLLSR